MNDYSNLLVISTGGTIEAKFYDNPHSPDHKIELLPENPLPDMLKRIGANARLIHAPKRQDSREFSEDDLDELTAFIIEYYRQGYHHIIASHGTFHMPRNFEYIEKKLAQYGAPNLTLIAVGANIPYHNSRLHKDHPSHAQSDALANLSFAAEQIFAVANGVYLADDGKLHIPSETEKCTTGRHFIRWPRNKKRGNFKLSFENT